MGVGINCVKIHKIPRIVAAYEAAVAEMITSGRIDSTPALVLYPDGTNEEVYNTTDSDVGDSPRVESLTGVPSRWEIQLAGTVKDARQRGVFATYLVGGCYAGKSPPYQKSPG